MNICMIGWHKWAEKITYKSEPEGILQGFMYFTGDVCELCGKHRYVIIKNYGMRKIIYSKNGEKNEKRE